MEDKNVDAFESEKTNFWKNFSQEQHIKYVQATNQETGDIILVPAEQLLKNGNQQILQQVNTSSYRHNLLQQNINPEQTRRIAQWLREQSSLLGLVTTQLVFHLLNLYEHLINVGEETKQLLEIEVKIFALTKDKEGNPVKVKLNQTEVKIEEIIAFLEKSILPGFDASGTWEICAKGILNYFSLSALERMEKDLGTKTIEEMNYISRKEAFHKYTNSEMLESLEDKVSLLLDNSSQEIAQAFITELDLPNLSLSDLDKLLGFKKYDAGNPIPVTELKLTNTALPVPTFAAFASGIMAQIRKDLWHKDSSGTACFQHQAKGNPNNYIEHYITSPGDIAVLPLEQAEQIIDKFGFNTVKMHLIFAAHTMNQSVPWEGKFSLKASDVIKYLGWDKRTDLPLHEKLNEIAKAAFVLDCLLVKSVWIEGKNRKGGINASTPTGRMWSVVVELRGQLNLEGKVDKPEEVYITVQPGLIFQSFLNKAGSKLKEALYQFGYLAQDILKIDPYHDELALRLAIHLTMDSRIHVTGKYRVTTLLETILPRIVIDAARSDKRKGYDLKQRWDNALTLLVQLGWQFQFDESYPEWLQPGSLVPKPEDSRKIKIIERLLQAKLTINPPKPIPELLQAKVKPKSQVQTLQPAMEMRLTGDRIRKAREAKGWSQRKLAGWMGVTQTLIGYWEKGKRTPSGDMEAKLKLLLEIVD